MKFITRLLLRSAIGKIAAMIEEAELDEYHAESLLDITWYRGVAEGMRAVLDMLDADAVPELRVVDHVVEYKNSIEFVPYDDDSVPSQVSFSHA